MPLMTADVLPAYEEFGIEKEEFERLMGEVVFGRKYLLGGSRRRLKKKLRRKPLKRRG